jgi:hypothetical protein
MSLQPDDRVDELVLDSSDARAEAQAQHGEGGEVDFGIAVGGLKGVRPMRTAG